VVVSSDHLFLSAEFWNGGAALLHYERAAEAKAMQYNQRESTSKIFILKLKKRRRISQYVYVD
jgi:hypothetical protein